MSLFNIGKGSSYPGGYAPPGYKDPVGLSGAQKGAIAGGVISGLTTIATSFIDAKARKNTYAFNAKMAQLQGRMTRLSADVEIKQIRRRAAAMYSSQRAGYAAAGLRLAGSPAAVMKESLKQAELDVIYANISADYNVGLTETQAGIYKMQGSQAKYKAMADTGKTLLKFGTSLYKILGKENR